MEENKKPLKGRIKFYILLLIISAAAIFAVYMLYRLPEVKAIQTAATVLMGQIVTIFAYECGDVYGIFLGRYSDKPGRFYVTYTILVALCVLFPAMPATAWPVIVIFILLTIMSNIPAGIMGGCMCLFIAGSALDAGMYSIIYVYLFVGIAGSVLIGHLDEKFKIGIPVAITEAILIVGLAVTMITSLDSVSIELMIYPAVNATVTFILLFFILKAYSARVIFKQKDIYLDLNDPECMILTELKNISPKDYHKTVHIVYFCDRVSSALGLDNARVKCAGLYHRIGVIGGEYNWDNTRMICEEQQLPAVVMDILKEFEDPSVPMTRPETAVLYMCECVVSSIQYLFAKNKDINIDYPSLIEMIFKQKTESGVFKNCDISIRQFEQMKKVFVEEKLYYDFMR